MKVGLYVPSWPPGSAPNGIVTYASQLVPELRRLGHDVFVLAPRPATQDDSPYTIDLRRYSSSPTLWERILWKFAPRTASFNASSPPIALAVKDLVTRHGLDVFEMEESFGWSHAISRLKLVPVVVRLHGPWFINSRFGRGTSESAQDRRRAKREGAAIQNAHYVTSSSAAVLHLLKAHYNLDLTNSQVIHNPLQAASEEKIWNAATCDINRLLFVGRFDALKGGDLILRAFAELAISYPQLKLTFVGPDIGITADDRKVHSFEQFMRSNFPERLRPRIDFRGQTGRSGVMGLRTMHLATIIASHHEVFPYSVLEAMSLGCPLVATAVGGIPEIIQDRRNGLLVPPADSGSMISACRMLIEDRALAARLGRQAWLDCRKLYDPHVIAAQTVAAYQAAIDAFERSSQLG